VTLRIDCEQNAMRILVVEDEAVAAAVLAKGLREHA
jgi:CheY-like chemotaxis protein